LFHSVQKLPAVGRREKRLLYASNTTVSAVLRRIIGSELFLRQADNASVALFAEETAAFGLGLRFQIDAIVGTLDIARRSIPYSICKFDVPAISRGQSS